MRCSFAGLLLLAACSTEPASDERLEAAAPSSSAASLAMDYSQLEEYSGRIVTLVGTFQHDRATTGIVVLDSGLRVMIPHFDHFAVADDWLKFVGHRCWATGRLHTWTKNLPDYRGPTLEITEFTGRTSD